MQKINKTKKNDLRRSIEKNNWKQGSYFLIKNKHNNCCNSRLANASPISDNITQ